MCNHRCSRRVSEVHGLKSYVTSTISQVPKISSRSTLMETQRPKLCSDVPVQERSPRHAWRHRLRRTGLMTHGSLRLRLAFDSNLKSDALQTLSRHIMYQPVYLPHDIAGLASLIQHDFGVNEPGGLELSIDTWRLPLCSSIAVLRDNDNVQVSRSSGPEPSLQVSGGFPWAQDLPAVPQKHGQQHGGPLAIENGTILSPAQQKPLKKRKREQPCADKAPAPKASVLPKAQVPVAEPDDSEESESESESSEDEDAVPAKRPSRNARRKKHKRQLKRLGLLDSRPAGTPSSQNRQQHEVPQGPVIREAARTNSVEMRKAAERPARSGHEEPEQAPEQGHTKLPKRGEQWQQSADVAEFLQKGHVHFTDSDSEDEASRAPEAPAVHEQALQKLPALANGTFSKHNAQQQPHEMLVAQYATQGQQAEHTRLLNYDALPKPHPYPLEGDVIAYRLLHIGADWTPQVSEWREGRILSLDTAEQSIVVEPWGQHSTVLHNGQAQDGGSFEGDGEEEEQPPTEYDEEGVLTTSLHSFADLRIIKDMASSAPGSGAKERWRHRAEHLTGAGEAGRDGVDEPGRLPGPPLRRGRQPDGGSTGFSRLSQPHNKPVSRHPNNQEQQLPLSAERRQHDNDNSQPALVAAESSQLPQAQQTPAEPGASQIVSCAELRPETLPEADQQTGSDEAAPAARVMPTAAPFPPTHSPVGPPVPGRAIGRSPAGFAQVAAALKARRAELAARQKAQAAQQQQPLAADSLSGQIAAALKHMPAQAPSQPDTPAKSPQDAAALLQASADLALMPHGSQAAEQQAIVAAQAMCSDRHEVRPSADLASQPRPAVGASQELSSGAIAQESYGVKTRSAARVQEHATLPTALPVPLGIRPSRNSSPETELPNQEGSLEGTGQVHTKRPRASTRGSLIGPLLARLRREEAAAGNGSAAD